MRLVLQTHRDARALYPLWINTVGTTLIVPWRRAAYLQKERAVSVVFARSESKHACHWNVVLVAELILRARAMSIGLSKANLLATCQPF